jgi:hypothetical protein
VHNLRHRLVSATGLALLLVVFWASFAAAQDQAGDFTVVVLPDTQYYSASYPQIFNSQTQWIAANRDALNIQLVIGVGDIVDGPMQTSQWQNADAAVKYLDGVVPYVLAIGNHDYDNVVPGSRQVTSFNQWFGPARYAAYPWYGGNFPEGSNENFYANVTLGGVDYLILALEYIPRQSALDWADGILKANPAKPAILVTHSYMYRDNTTIDQCDTGDNTPSTKTNGLDGLTLWHRFVSQYPNITTVLSGHILGVGQRSDLGVNGNLVNQMLVDYQGWANGGNGYLRILTFQPSLNQVQVQTYSPYLGKYLTDSGSQYVWNSQPIANLSGTGSLKGNVRTARIGATGADCKPVPGATVATSSSTLSADENGSFMMDSGLGEQDLSGSDEGFLVTTDHHQVNAGFTTDAPLFLYPDQYSQNLCDISSATDHSVTFCAPTSTTVSSQFRVAAESKVTSGFINLMQLYVDGVKNTELATNKLDTTLTLGAGTHVLLAKARDSFGVFFSNTFTVSVPAPPPPTCNLTSAPTPSVIICTPGSNAAVTSPAQVIAQAKDSNVIKRMQLYLDGVLKFTVSSSQLNTSVALTGGTHRITVVSTNSANAILKATELVTVPVAPLCDVSAAPTPSVTICSPAAAQTGSTLVSSPLQVQGQGKDSLPISRMQLYVDGVAKSTVSSDQLNVSVALSSGPHRLTVMSTNSANATSKSTLNVTVQ